MLDVNPPLIVSKNGNIISKFKRLVTQVSNYKHIWQAVQNIEMNATHLRWSWQLMSRCAHSHTLLCIFWQEIAVSAPKCAFAVLIDVSGKLSQTYGQLELSKQTLFSWKSKTRKWDCQNNSDNTYHATHMSKSLTLQ